MLRGPRVELEAAALGGDRDPQRVAREHQSRCVVGSGAGGLAGAARLARPVDLQHALARGEAARRRDLLDQRLDVGAEELERPVAGLADEMEVARMPVRVLEPEPAFAEVHLAGDAGVHHPLQRAVDGGAADAGGPRGGSGPPDRRRSGGLRGGGRRRGCARACWSVSRPPGAGGRRRGTTGSADGDIARRRGRPARHRRSTGPAASRR